MDVREKLVELANDVLRYLPWGEIQKDTAERIADRMMDHGVTVQEWISVEKQMPPYNTDVLVYRPNMEMKIIVDSYDGYYGEDDEEWYEGWRKYGKDIHNNPIITHWAKLPQPPKGE